MKGFHGDPDFEYDLAIRQNNVRRLQTLKRLGVPPCELAVLYAVKLKHPQLIALLVEAGANPDEKDAYKDTALGYAVQFCDDEAVKLVLDAGADVELESLTVKPIVNAATWGKTGALRMLLERGADPNGRNPTGLTALLQAVRYGYLEIVKLLIEAGADPSYKGPDGLDAVALAKSEGHEDLVPFLKATKRKKSKTGLSPSGPTVSSRRRR